MTAQEFATFELCSSKMCPEHSNVQATAGVYAEPLQRLARMLRSVSATNEAILRTTAADELYQQVCDAALSGGNSDAAPRSCCTKAAQTS